MKSLSAVSMLSVIACTALPLLTTPSFADDSDPAPASGAAGDVETPATPAPADGAATPSTAPADAPPKDDGPGLEWIWLDAGLGFSYSDLKSAKLAISPTGGTPITVVDTTSAGLVYGFGAGIRLLFLTIGLRARNHAAMNLWQIDAEVGIRGRGKVQPYLVGRFGYDTVGTLGQSVQVAGSSVAPPDVTVHGWNAGLAFGVDYYFTHVFSIGAEASGDVLFLSRPPATPPSLTADQKALIDADPTAKANYQKLQDAYQASASSVGFGGGLSAHVGIHF